MILLTKDTASVELELRGSVLCVHHERYAPPRQFHDAIPWKLFEAEFQRIVDSAETLVVVGLNRIITPANRVRVGSMVLRPRGWRRISIDNTLFRSEPWRAWFHFGCTQAPYHGYTYSYLAETDWRGFVEGVRPSDPFSAQKIMEAGVGVLRSEYSQYFDAPEIVVHETTAAQKLEYTELKTAAFEEEHTLSAILKRLGDYAQSICRPRSLPDASRLFDREGHRFVVTDLKIDEFLVHRLRGLMDLTNEVARGSHRLHS